MTKKIFKMLRVGTITYRDGKRVLPSYEGFKRIVVLTKSSTWGDLGPYVLKDNHGRIMENIWQAAKVYPDTPKVKERYSRFDRTIIWERDSETYIDYVHDLRSYNLTEEYYQWRSDLEFCEYPVRYPVGRKYRHNCLFALSENNMDQPLTYIEARKEIYLPVYCDLVKEQDRFHMLKGMLDNGTNLLIIEVDGPIQRSLEYYMNKYGVDERFIERNTIEVTRENMEIMLNDEKHPFGHGYCLAMALLGVDEEWNPPTEKYRYENINSAIISRVTEEHEKRDNLLSKESLTMNTLTNMTVADLRSIIRKEKSKGYSYLTQKGKKIDIAQRLFDHFNSL